MSGLLDNLSVTTFISRIFLSVLKNSNVINASVYGYNKVWFSFIKDH